jgi:neutral ceramidase
MAASLLRAFLGILVACNLAAAGASEWKAGFATVKITPEVPVMMSGYANRLKPFERVAQDIFAKAIALEDGAGQRAVLVTSDLVGMDPCFVEPLVREILAKTGLKREQLLLTWSHSHAGPLLIETVRPRPGVAVTDAENGVAYTKWLHGRLVELVVAAGAKLEPVKLSHGRGVAKFVMNRREFTAKGIILGVAPQGPADRSVPVLRIDAADGRPRAILFGTAAHNTTLGARNLELCGDYAGFAQHFLQEKYPGVQAMFMMGCGGDANPYPRDSLEIARGHGVELGQEVARVFESKLRPLNGPLRLAFGRADLPLQRMTAAQLKPLTESSPNWQIGNARKMLALLERGENLPTHYAAPISVWQFGSDLTLVAIPGEPVVDYVHLVEKAIGPLNLWTAGYTHEDFGYLPSARVVAEGGYETRGLNSGDGWFAAEAQDAVVAKVRELAQQVARP